MSNHRQVVAVILVTLTALYAQEAPASDGTGPVDTPVGSQTRPNCPGECVHAFTAFFCEKILENAQCEVNHYSCCVPKDLSFGTLVETSPPLSEDSDIPTEPNLGDGDQDSLSAQESAYADSSDESAPSTTTSTTVSPTVMPSYYTRVKPKLDVQPTSETLKNSTHDSPTATTENEIPIESPTVYVINQPHPCNGICVENQYAKYCANVVRNAVCTQPGKTCCLPDNTPSPNNGTNNPRPPNINNPKPLSSVNSNPRPLPPVNSNPRPLPPVNSNPRPPSMVANLKPNPNNEDYPQETPNNQYEEIPIEENNEKPSTFESNCRGTCVNSFFSLLCDKIDYEAKCDEGGFCCVSNAQDESVTTTEDPVGPCPGTCVLTVLSGFCNRPSELIVKTSDCNPDTICCYTPPDKQFPPENHPPQQPPLDESELGYPQVRPTRKPDYFNTRPQHQPNQIPPRPITRPNNNYNVQPYPSGSSGSYELQERPHSNSYGYPSYPDPLPKPQRIDPPQFEPQYENQGGHYVNQESSQGSQYGNQGGSFFPQGNQYGNQRPTYGNVGEQNIPIQQGDPLQNQGVIVDAQGGSYVPVRDHPGVPQRMDVRPGNGQIIPNRLAVSQNIPQSGGQDIIYNGHGNPYTNPATVYNGHGSTVYSEQASYQNGKIVPSRGETNLGGHLGPSTAQGNTPQGQGNIPQGHINLNQGQVDIPQGQVNPNHGQVNNPQGQLNQNHGQVNNPQGQLNPNHGQVNNPQGQLIPNHGQVNNPQGQLIPNHGQVNNPQGQLIPNHGQVNNPQGQINPIHGQIGSSNIPDQPNRGQSIPHNGYGISLPQESQLVSLTQTGHGYSGQGTRPNGQGFSQNVPVNNQFYPHREKISPNNRPSYEMAQPQGIQHPQPVSPAPVAESSEPETPEKDTDSGYEYPELPNCLGHCVSPFFRFTCTGNNAIYNGFSCPKAGMLCCAPMNEIQKYEDILRPGAIAGNKNYTSQQDSVVISGSSTTTTTTTTTTSTTPKPLIRKPPGRYVCGVKGTSRVANARVTGGSDSQPGEWCWQVALINAQNQYLCGGALIGSQWVLTAAHCVTTLVRNGDSIFARVGDYDLKSKRGSPDAQTRKISTSYIHHNHNSQTLDNDIALLKLQTPVDLSDHVCLVCLPARGTKHKAGKRCTVTGYGYQGETGPIALKIREAEIPIVEEQDCTVQINAVTEKLFILPASSFCAGGEAGNDACQGDGGGPLVCKVDNFFELTGLVSWGFGCGREAVPGVYVKVSSFIGWVNQIISVNSS